MRRNPNTPPIIPQPTTADVMDSAMVLVGIFSLLYALLIVGGAL